jgi:hypothetical protein
MGRRNGTCSGVLNSQPEQWREAWGLRGLMTHISAVAGISWLGLPANWSNDQGDTDVPHPHPIRDSGERRFIIARHGMVRKDNPQFSPGLESSASATSWHVSFIWVFCTFTGFDLSPRAHYRLISTICGQAQASSKAFSAPQKHVRFYC